MHSGHKLQSVLPSFFASPLTPAAMEDQYLDIPSKIVTSYLESYVNSHTYKDKIIRNRTMFITLVQQVELVDNG